MEPDRPTTTGFRHAPEPSRDRARQVRSARRHSFVVRFLRVALPVSAIAIFGYYGATLLEVAGWSNPVAKIAIPKVLPEHLTMSNPRYQGYTKDGGNYTFEAKTARQDLKTPTFIHLNGVTGTLLQADNAATRLSAARGTYDARRQIATLVGAIRINADDGGWARLISATITPKDGIIASTLPVAVGNKSGVIRAKTMTVRQKTKEITFNGDVHARLAPAEGVIGDIDGKGNLRITPSAKSAPAKAPETAQDSDASAGGAMARLFQGGDSGPIEIKAQRLDVDDLKRTATFTGGVTVTRGAATLTSPELRIAYDGSPSGGLAGGSKPVAQGGAGGVRSSIKTIVATGPVVITEGETTRVTGATALYDAGTARATIDGGVVIDRAPATRVTAALATFDTARDIASLDRNVVMSQGADRRVTGDHAELHNKDGTALITGNVVMTQGTNVLRGRRLTLDQKAGRSQLTAVAGDGGTGRINAQFAPNATKGGGGKAARPAATGAGANPLGGLLSTASFRTDPNAPIGIVAERLDVDDKSGEAVFRGDVVATQGEVSLRSSEVHARYSGSAGLAGGGEQTEKAAQTPVQLAKIQAKGSVIVTSKAGQKATGDWADFNTAANTVTLGGDVVLTQGRNVVRGSRLDIDLNTGEAVLKSDNAAAPEAAEQAGGGWKASRQPSRPRAVFFPQDLRGEGAAKPAVPNPRASPAAVDGWSSTTNDGPRPAADN